MRTRAAPASTPNRAHARLPQRRAGLRARSLGREGQPDARQDWDRRGPGGDGLGRAQWPSQSPEEPKAGPQTAGPDLGCLGPARAPPSTTSGPQASAICQSSLRLLAAGEGRVEAPLGPRCWALMWSPPVLSTSAHRGASPPRTGHWSGHWSPSSQPGSLQLWSPTAPLGLPRTVAMSSRASLGSCLSRHTGPHCLCCREVLPGVQPPPPPASVPPGSEASQSLRCGLRRRAREPAGV